ncbi:MAG: hypothetical protein ABR497_08690 [Kiritimatiellia bacterium]|nr:hypothetical protein [Lentisphaerota bacterium]
MTQIAKLMEWCGTVERCGRPAPERMFDFPKRVLRSVRFGPHDFVMDKTMQIVPVRQTAVAAPNRAMPGARLLRSAASVRPAFSVPAECRKNVRSWFIV